jgi:hypothetical protein
VSQRFKSIVALWFVLQIALPFTAPVHTCDLGDLLGTTSRHGVPAAPDSSTHPTMPGEAESDVDTFTSPLDASSLRASAGAAVVCRAEWTGTMNSTFDLSPSPHVQHTVLRV